MIIELLLDQQPFEVKSLCIVDKEGSLFYKCELLGSPISTFAYWSKYEGKTQDEALGKLAFELRRALEELLEI